MTLNSKHDIPILWEVIGEECYSPLPKLPRDSVIVDIGANIGSFTLLLLQKYPSARVYSYEPMSKNFILLKNNINENRFFGKAHPIQMAVAGEEGNRELNLTIGGDSGHHSLIKSTDDNYGGTEIVKCTTLDKILEQLGVIDLLKIDAEGAETEMLSACSYLDKVKHIFIEGNVKNCSKILEENNFAVISKGGFLYAKNL